MPRQGIPCSSPCVITIINSGAGMWPTSALCLPHWDQILSRWCFFFFLTIPFASNLSNSWLFSFVHPCCFPAIQCLSPRDAVRIRVPYLRVARDWKPRRVVPSKQTSEVHGYSYRGFDINIKLISLSLVSYRFEDSAKKKSLFLLLYDSLKKKIGSSTCTDVTDLVCRPRMHYILPSRAWGTVPFAPPPCDSLADISSSSDISADLSAYTTGWRM